MTRKKKILKQKLFNEAYEAMRDFIRKRDANFQGYITCCSSGKIIPLEDAQLGHWRHGKNLECYFWPTNVHMQSAGQNYFGGQDTIQNYTLFIVRKYGLKEAERIRNAKPIYWTNEKLIKIRDYFKAKK